MLEGYNENMDNYNDDYDESSVKAEKKAARKSSRSLLTELDFSDSFSDEEDDGFIHAFEKEDSFGYSDQIDVYKGLREQYNIIKPSIKSIDENFDHLPLDKRFAELARLRDLGGLDAEFAKIACSFYVYKYAMSICKKYRTFMTANNYKEFESTTLLAITEAFSKFDPKETNGKPLTYFGSPVFAALFIFVNEDIFGRKNFDARQCIFVGKCIQELKNAGVLFPEAGDIALQQFLKLNTAKLLMSVGKIKSFMVQLESSIPTVSIYASQDEEEGQNLLDTYDTSDKVSYDLMDPARIAFDNIITSQIYKHISGMVKDKRDAQAFIMNRCLDMSIADIERNIYCGSIKRDTITRRLNDLSQKIKKSESLAKLRYGVNELDEIEHEKVATIASTEELLDELMMNDEFESVASQTFYDDEKEDQF